MSHWYTFDAKPMHHIVGQNGKERPTTLADARKHKLLPSVTTVLDIVGSKSLEDYKIRQALFYAKQCPSNISDGEMARYVKESMDDDLERAASGGTELHSDLEEFSYGRECKDSATWADVAAKLRIKEFIANEVTMADIDIGVGGTCDLVIRNLDDAIVISDLKSKKEPGKSGFYSSDTHILQLGAYYLLARKDKRLRGLFSGRPTTAAIIFVSRLNRGGGVRTNDIKFYTNEQLVNASIAFQHLVHFWQATNDYTPGL